MAKFRQVYTEFWSDPKVIEEMTPEDKFFMLYLITNQHTSQIGVYQITKKQIAFEMGYSMESINSLISRFENVHKSIRYNLETREMAIKNWGKYNFFKGGKPIYDLINSELRTVKDVSLLCYVFENYIKTSNINTNIIDIFKGFFKERNIIDDTHNDTPTTGGQDIDIDIDVEEDKDIDKDIDNNIIILREDEAQFLKELKKIKNYPLDREKDLEMFNRLTERYPTLDLVESIKDWAIYKQDKPLGVKDNPRSQINSSFKKYVEWGKNLKGGGQDGSKQPTNEQDSKTPRFDKSKFLATGGTGEPEDYGDLI